MPNKESMDAPEPLPFRPRDTPSEQSASIVPAVTPPADDRTRRRLSRRHFLQRLIIGGGGLGGGLFLYSAFWEPNQPRVERVTIRIRNLPPAFDGVRVAAMSDLHVQPGFPAIRLQPALRLVEREKPDAIFLLGDYVNAQEPDRQGHMEACAHALSVLSAPLGVFACFGNHDFPIPPADPPRLMWQEAGIIPLADEIAEIERGGERLWVVGLRSLLQRPVSPMDTLGRIPLTDPKIVLWHEPDRVAQCIPGGASLMLSGHTHGGQVRLPGWGALRLPAGGQLYPYGLFSLAGIAGQPMSLYVTRGVGLLPPMLRFNCPPEVTLLTLKRDDGKV